MRQSQSKSASHSLSRVVSRQLRSTVVHGVDQLSPLLTPTDDWNCRLNYVLTTVTHRLPTVHLIHGDSSTFPLARLHCVDFTRRFRAS